jgi:MFS transporter, PPP family, 3-phenylpropionic acid transporter
MYFALVGGLSPYLALYLSEQGHSIERIGVLMALPQIVRIFAPPFWGWLADRTRRYGLLLKVSALANLGLMAALPGVADSYAGVFVLLSLLYFAGAAQGPIAEANALAIAGADSGRYGKIRLWGSIGFLLAVVLVGPVLDALGTDRLPQVLTLIAAILLAVVWLLPETTPAVNRPGSAKVRDRLREPVVALFFASAFLMMFAHAALYAFFSLYLERFGYSKTAIGLIWSIGVVAEIALFRVQKRLFERFGAARLLGTSLAVAMIRFALVAASGGGLLLILATQLLHAVTFGVHHSACMNYLQRWFEPRQQARAQALFITIAYGLGGTCGGIVASVLWTKIMPASAFWGAALASLLAWSVFGWCQRLDRSTRLGTLPHV